MFSRLTRWASARTRTASLALVAAALASLAAPLAHAFNPDTISPSTISLTKLNYYNAPMFADAIKMAREWQTRGANNVDYTINPGHNKLNSVGLPTATSPSEVFTTWFQAGNVRTMLRGRYVVSWTGTGDVTMTGGNVTFVSGTAPGVSNGGRRVYSFTGNDFPFIQATGLTSSGLSSLNVWLPHPDSPTAHSLEPAERTAYNTANNITESPEAFYFSPVLVRILKERSWGAIRFMDTGATNDNPTRNWSERRKPAYSMQTNGLISRNPTTGVAPETSNGTNVWKDPGIAWEYAVALCNATGRNLWISVPHLSVLSIGSSDDYPTNLAKGIAYGADANGTPYASTYTGTKVYKGLNTGLEVYLEYSNEVWNPQFKQQQFAEGQRTDTNVPQQVAINSLKVWQAFETVPALKSTTTDRVVRLLGCQQVNGFNLMTSLNELYTAGLDGISSHADAVTTASYFGNGIELYVRDAILEGQPHPRAHEVDPTQPGGQYPAYTYTTAASQRLTTAYFDKAMDEWLRRVLVGDTAAGNAYDTTGSVGGIDQDVFNAAAARGLRIVATEGGASIYTDQFDSGSPQDDLLTNFVAKFPELDRMSELMKLHLEFGRMRTLRSYNIYTLTGDTTKYGQWGVLDLDGQHGTAVKALRYRAIRDWLDEFSTIRHVDLRIGTAPSFTTAEDLGEFRISSAMSRTISTTNATSLKVVAKVLVPGLSVAISGTSATISGTPSKPGMNFVLLRAMDNEKDPTWRVYRFNVKHWAHNNYFNDLATHTSPVSSFISGTRYIFSSENGSAALKVEPIIAGDFNKVLRVTGAVPLNVEYNTASTDPLNNQPFNLDTLQLGRSSTSVIGVRLQGLSEGGKVTVTEDITLSGAVNTIATFTRDSTWDNLFSLKVTFYSARTYNNSTQVYDITPVAGGIVDDVGMNY